MLSFLLGHSRAFAENPLLSLGRSELLIVCWVTFARRFKKFMVSAIFVEFS